MSRFFSFLTDTALGDAIAGDLEQERRRRARSSRAGAFAWYWRSVFAIAVSLAARRLGDTMREAITRRFGMGLGPGEWRQTARAVARTPWYSLTAIGVVTLSLALATTVFAIVDGVLFQPLPYQRAAELYRVQPSIVGASRMPGVSPGELHDWADALQEVRFAAFTSPTAIIVGSGMGETRLTTAGVDERLFDVLGVRPLLGGFQTDDFRVAAPIQPAILSYRTWQTRFGGDPAIVDGRVVPGPYAAIRIVGVMPDGFVFPAQSDVQVLTPIAAGPEAVTNRGPRARRLGVIARVPTGLTPTVVSQRIEAVMQATRSLVPAVPLSPSASEDARRFTGPLDRATLSPLAATMTTQQRPLFSAVFGAAAALVLLACLNVAGLMTARHQHRRQSMALRRALGASTLQVARLVWMEGLLLVGIGAVLGLGMAWPLLRLTVRLLPDGLALLKDPAIDWRVAGFVMVSAVLCAGVVGARPVWNVTQHGESAPLAAGARATRRTFSFERLIIGGQVAVGLALTIGGALLVGSLAHVHQQNPGFDVDRVMAVTLRVPATSSPGLAPDFEPLLTRLRSLPGVVNAGITDGWVFAGSNAAGWLHAPGKTSFATHAVTSGFFDVLESRLVEGRLPSVSEMQTRSLVVASRTAADALWPGQSALGQQVEGPGHSYTVVGVVDDARYSAWDQAPAAVMFGPYAALAMSPQPTLLIRMNAAGTTLDRVLQAVRADTTPMAVTRAAMLSDLLNDTVRVRRFQSWLFGGFAGAAVVIVGVGVLGLVAMTTAGRTREVGVRVALGATSRMVASQFLREQFTVVAAGLVAGGLLSAWAVRFVASYLYELTTHDPRVWVAAIVIMILTAGLGALIPSWRASRVDPVRALRVD